MLPAFGFGLRGGGLSGNGLVDFEISHFQFAEEVEEQTVFFGREIAFGFLVQGVEHVDELARRVGIEHRLASAWVGVGAKDHRGIAAQHAHQAFKTAGRFWRIGGWRRGGGLLGFRSFGGLLDALFALGFTLELFDGFFAQFAVRSKRAAIDHAECRVFLLVLSQGTNPFGVIVSNSSHK